MKTWLVCTTLISLSIKLATAQTAEDYIDQGRAYLAQTNLLAANTCFSNAVGISATNQTANALYGISRVLVWPNQPVGSNFLSKLGVPAAGRDIFNWTAFLPTDTNRVLQAPTGVWGTDLSAMARTNLSSLAAAAEANFARITDTNFLLALTVAETHSTAVTLDFGDFLMLRAMLQASEYLSYTLYSWDLNAELTVVKGLYNNHLLDFGTLVTQYPNLLKFATTNDLGAAQAAFLSGVARYQEASQWIHQRPADQVRLFNLNPAKAWKEQQFRLTLADLAQSLNGIVSFRANSAYSVFLAPHFQGLRSPRSLLPVLRGQGFGLGTFPDMTFGGTIFGVQRGDIEPFWATFMNPLPWIPQMHPLSQPGFTVNTLKSSGYVVQVSTDLINWTDHAAFVALGETYDFVDSPRPGVQRIFYRVVDRPLPALPPPANDNFTNSTHLTGLGIIMRGYDINATKEPNEPGYFSSTVWYDWTAPSDGLVVVATTGSDSYQNVTVYTGTSLNSLVVVPDAGSHGHRYNGAAFYAVAGITYHIQVSGWGGIQLEIGPPPQVEINSPADGTFSYVPTNFLISATATAVQSPVRRLRCLADGNLLASTNGNSLSVLWTNVGLGNHFIEADAADSLGITSYASVTVSVRPTNDLFASAVPISGAPLQVSGINLGATREVDEPNIAGYPGGASVWWRWTAPSNGVVTISASLFAVYQGTAYAYNPLLGVYLGSNLATLAPVAEASVSFGLTTAQVTFVATAGQEYKIAVDGEYGYQGNIILRFTPGSPPVVVISSPQQDTTFRTSGTTNISITATASDTNGTVAQVVFYGDYSVIGTAATAPYSTVWSNVGWGNHTLFAVATDNSGLSMASDAVYINVAPPAPPNDDFTNALQLPSVNAFSNGNNVGASREPGEPFHDGWYGGRSVWFRWTAPSTGNFRVVVSTSTVYLPVLAVYTGFQLTQLAYVNSGTGQNFNLDVPFYAIAGQSYAIAFDDPFEQGGPYNLAVAPQ